MLVLSYIRSLYMYIESYTSIYFYGMLYTLIYICHLGIYWNICRISCSTTGCTDGGGPWGHPSDPEGGVPVHALRMMSFFMHRMPRARKRLSTGLWRVWNNRNAVAFHRFIDSCLVCLCLCRRQLAAWRMLRLWKEVLFLLWVHGIYYDIPCVYQYILLYIMFI